MKITAKHMAVFVVGLSLTFSCERNIASTAATIPAEVKNGNPVAPPGPIAPPVRRPADEGFDVFNEVARPMGLSVDGIYSRYRELLVQRAPQSEYRVDSCEANLQDRDSFADRIAFYVAQFSRAHRSQLSYVSGPFDLPKDVKSMVSTSLLSHPFCEVSRATLNDTFRGRKIPNQTVINKMNVVNQRLNQYRKQALMGDTNGLVKANRLLSKMMMCLSYVESLTTADTNRSKEIAAQNGIRKPAGVKYYMDALQKNPASRFNIGLYQFSPDSAGGVQACIREWNLRYPQCSMAQNSSWQALTRVLGSPVQTFNSFCGVYRIATMFGLQVNTTSRDHTHPFNVTANGRLKPAVERCVSPFMNTVKSYNHFGPLQNSTEKNLDQLLTCTLRE